MAISLIQATNRIFVPIADLTVVSASPLIYSIEMEFFHNELRTLETLEANCVYEITHEHVPPFDLDVIVLQRVLKIIGLWEVEFEYLGTPYAVQIIGGNSNIDSKAVVNEVSVRSFNTAGAIEVGTSGLTALESVALLKAVALMESDEVYDKSTGLLHIYARGTSIDLVPPKAVVGAVTADDVTLIEPP